MMAGVAAQAELELWFRSGDRAAWRHRSARHPSYNREQSRVMGGDTPYTNQHGALPDVGNKTRRGADREVQARVVPPGANVVGTRSVAKGEQ